MANLLRYNSAQGSSAQIAYPIWIGEASGNWSVIVSFVCTSFAATPRVIGSAASVSNRALVIGTTGFLSWVSVGIAGAAGSLAVNTRYWVKLESIGATKNLYQSTDGVNFTLVGTASYSAANMDWVRLGSASATRSTVFDFYSIEFSGSSYTDSFTGATAPASGATWPSTSATRDITLTNFADTTSCWVSYGGGSADNQASSGSAAATASGVIQSNSLEPFDKVSSGSAVALSTGFFDSTWFYENLAGDNQVSSGTALALATGVFDATVNQVLIGNDDKVSSGTLTAFATGVSDNSFESRQEVISSGSAVAVSYGLFKSVYTESAIGQEHKYSSGFALATSSGVVDSTVEELYDSGWGVPTTLFNESTGVTALALTFDQNGRPLVFFQTANGELKLYWYKPIVGAIVIETITTGRTPVAGFDYINNITYNESDAWLFYARGNTVYSRLQRESWEIEHVVKTYPTAPYVESAGYTVDGVFQVIVKSEGVCEILMQTATVTDNLELVASVFSLTFVETFTPINPDAPVDDAPSNPDPVEETPVPTTPQGFYINKYNTGGWVYWSTLIDETGGRAFSFKVKKEYTPYGESIFLLQGGYIQKSTTNRYYQSTFSISERDGLIRIKFLGEEFTCPRFWTGEVPKFKLRVQLTKTKMLSVTYWKETANGLGYESPVSYAFPAPFVDTSSPPFMTENEEKMGLGCLPMGAFGGNTQCNTIIRDVVVESEDAFGFFQPYVSAPMDLWNVQYQYNFYNINYKPQYWVTVTEA